MDIYFSVPVDRTALKECRKAAGYPTAKAFQEELNRRDIAISYRNIENTAKDTQGNPKRIRGDVAAILAEVLGVAPDTAFPAYSVCKAAAEQETEERYYKPFTTTEERNSAIVDSMEAVRRAALKHCHLLKNQNGGHFLEQDDIIGIAYVALIEAADRAMKKGIKKGVSFEAVACVTVKNCFLVINKHNRAKRYKAELYSMDADDFYNIRADIYSVEDEIVAREELRQALKELSAAERRKLLSDL